MPEEKEWIIEREMELPERTPEEQQDDYRLFCENLELILEKSDVILSREELFYCSFHRALVGNYIMGGRHMPVGVLILLWKDGKMKAPCEHCGEKAFIIRAGGSPLSGRNNYRGYCPNCRNEIHGSYPHFGSLWGPAFEMKSRYRNTQLIRIRKTRFFSWKHGTVGEETPDEILRHCVQGVIVRELVDALKGAH